MGTLKPTRTERRRHFDDATRLSLLEDDTDQLESAFKEVREGQTRIQQLMWGLMSALLVAVILLALNLAIGRFPLPGT